MPYRGLAVLAAMACLSPGANAVPVTTDLWDLSQGTVITGNSATRPDSDIGNMFGGSGGVEEFNTLFQEGQPQGFVHFVEWETATAVTVEQINVWASHDLPPPMDANDRGFSRVTIFADGATVLDLFTTNPYDFGSREFGLLFEAILPSAVTASSFRAEFVQFGDETFPSGPRVWELDAFGRIAVPEPATLALLGMGLGLLGLARRRRC